uniref:Predicted protein n=1 Tax=Hordeum vulgare subsp. vulgare TaxID=112509 RepID=F2DS42_HORVV|nr:predicted protein [Hordeum vulgare subsp. vulgare]
MESISHNKVDPRELYLRKL